MSRLPRPCLSCQRIIPRGSYCEPCAPVKPSATARGYGSQWQRTSARIIKRDGGVCQIQLPGCTYTATTTGHVVPKSHGGDDDSNLRAACRHCNSSKGARR